MQTVVGLDLAGTDEGALMLAARLAAPEELHALHVVERFAVGNAMEHTPLADLEADARARASTRLAGELAAASLTVSMGEVAEEALVQQAQQAGAQALVLGRRAASKAFALVRLGRVARRVLRALPAATVVTPPDWTALGAGPIVLATDLAADSEGAARFATALARRLQRPLSVVHVIEDPRAFAGGLVDVALDPFVAGIERDARQRAGHWAASHGLGDAQLALLRGDPVRALLTHLSAIDAAVAVTGSRRASLANRVWRTSVGTTLAAHASCPVAVTPADWRSP